MLRHLWRHYRLLTICAAVGLVAALLILAHRFAVERAYHTVEITIDGDDWATLARRNGMDREALYAELYRRGVRSVTLYAASLRRLADSGLVTYMAGADALGAVRTGSLSGPLAGLANAGRINLNYTYVLGPLPVLRLAQGGFAIQMEPFHARFLSGTLIGDRGPVLEIAGRGRDLEDESLGLLPQEAEAARAHHLAVEFRVRNFRDVAPGGLDAFFTGLKQFDQAFTLIFDRDQVLGYDALLPDVAQGMKQNGFAFGRIEAFTARRQQKGEVTLAQLVAPNVIRVFSMAPEELAGSTPEDARDKFVLAARERNIRILYVRPFLSTSAGVNAIETNLDYVASIADDLVRAGYKMDKAVPLPVTSAPGWLFLLAALGALSVTAITAGEVGAALAGPVPARLLYASVAAGLLLTAAVIAAHHTALWRQILAFLAALAVPTLSMLWLIPGARRPEADPADGPAPAEPVRSAPESRPSGLRTLVRGVGGLWTVSAVTALGGILVAALLSEWQFMMEMRAFLGVKLAHIIPVVVIGLLIAAAGAPRRELWPRLRTWLRQPLLLEYGIAIIVIGVVVVFALGRTGNSGLPLLSSVELKSRVLLQRVLIARPRTKEYLIGDPFMVLAFALAAVGARRWVLPAAMLGAIGQVGLVNSFSHIHTPLVYVVARTVYSLVIGSVLGAILVGGLWWSRRWWAPSRPGLDVPAHAPAAVQAGRAAVPRA